MQSANGASQADLLSSIVTITDLLSHDDQGSQQEVETLERLIEAIARLKGVLIANEEVVESFGESGGFESLLKAVEKGTAIDTSIDEAEKSEENTETEDAVADSEASPDSKIHLRKELLQLTFAALSQALASSSGAKAFFFRVNGYTELEEIIRSSGALTQQSRRDYIFGDLFASCIHDFTHCHIFSSMRWHLNSGDLSAEEKSTRITVKIEAAFELTEQLPNPEFLQVIINLLPELTEDQDLGLAICIAVQVIVDANRSNQLTFFSSSAFSHLIERIVLLSSTWAADYLSSEQTEILEDLIFSLSPLGLPLPLTTSVISTSVQRIGSTSEASLLPFLQEFAVQSRLPAHFHFDMHPNGHSALQFPTLIPTFPPMSSAGYMLSLWMRIEKFDPDMHLTLFGAFDPSQKCFCMAYIEQDTHKLVLQTSLRSSVRFKLFEFAQGRWYHIVIAHKRPKTTSSARAILFVDGALVDQVKCSYPSSPPLPKAPVQAFFGTPPSFSNAANKPILQWSLAQAHLWADLLPEDLIEIIFQLGPRYRGNFQDSLGQFQTYDASTALNIRLAVMGGAKAEKSVLMAAVRGKGGTWAPESKLLLSISPLAVKNDSEVRILNCAVPRITDAFALENGVGRTIGGPVVVVPRSLDDAVWCLGGCAIGLKMVEKACSVEECLVAVKVLFETIRLSWRNSEDVERNHGYEILAFLLKAKKPKLINPDLLQVISEFVGMDFDEPRESSIINPLAFRYLCLDFAIWKRGSVDVQIAHLQTILSLVEQSRHRQFNLRRLNKMHVVKKMLFALRSGTFSRDVIPSFVATLKAVVKANFSTEVVRALATFVTSFSQRGNSKERKTTISRGSSSPVKKAFSEELDVPKVARKISGARDPANYEVVVLEMLVDILLSPERRYINKFATTITSKWALLLMSTGNPDHIIHGVKILARLLVTQGTGYVSKFSARVHGFPVLRNNLAPWWYITPIWPTILAVLFGVDVVTLKSFPPDQPLRLFDLVQLVKLGDVEPTVVFPEVFPIISALLKSGFDGTLRDANNGHILDDGEMTSSPDTLSPRPGSSGEGMISRESTSSSSTRSASLLQVVVQFLLDMHTSSSSFREFAASPQVMENLLAILFPIVCSADPVNPETELMSKDSILTFDTGEVRIESLTLHHTPAPVLRPASSLSVRSVDSEESARSSLDRPGRPRASSLRRASSYVLIASDTPPNPSARVTINPSVGTKTLRKQPPALNVGNSVVGSLLELVTAISVDAVLGKRDFSNLDFSTKLPPSFQEHQIYFVTYLLRNTLSHLDNAIAMDRMVLCQSSRTLNNVIRFCHRLTDAVFEGWFLNGAPPLWEFVGGILDFLDTPDIAKQKIVKSTESYITTLRKVFNRLTLFQLSDIEDSNGSEDATIALLDRVLFWQNVLFSSVNQDNEFFRMFCYHLYVFLFDTRRRVRLVASNVWRLMQLNKTEQVTNILNFGKTPEHIQVSSGFMGIMETDADTFLLWLDAHRPLMDQFFMESMAPPWEQFVITENKASEEATKTRMTRRRERLKTLVSQEASVAQALARNDIILSQWQANIHDIEHVRFLKTLQDTADHAVFVESSWNRLLRQITRERAILDPHKERRWRLDMTEGRSRMRKKLMPDIRVRTEQYQPKGSSLPPPVPTVKTPDVTPSDEMDDEDAEVEQQSGAEELDFEVVDPDEPAAIEEDKNRKVLRSLEHGDTVVDVFNVSRIIGLDAHEGLLILGKSYIYLIDHYFQRSDQEIVDVWDAPTEERDPFIQILAGQDASTRPAMLASKDLHESRKWPNDQLVSASQRRFLFRDVALELFFSDGRSCLVTMSQADRNRAYTKLAARITAKSPTSIFQGLDGAEDVKGAGAVALTSQIGSRLVNVLSAAYSIPATKSWEKGLISNFHYLMILNSLAGRSYNDLTQYPVAPWVLADYSSDELDLTNPATFRDFSKPMGAQVPERQADFEERYHSFEEIEDRSQPPFHYGTHYSSAMIVCSYLIRLQPLVESYLLLQGGQFDHAERLFHSIGKAWNSASRDNMTDVRELIPEFFYLDAFLSNHNSFNFGVKQDDGEVIDSVVLPPWAKGDPKVFIQRHREALECDYVSEHLHEWIDLIFGYKQRGEAAVKATNVFHHLSYQGSIDLEKISDPVERLASINIIHNFGQTPKQLFTKPHPKRKLELRQPHFEECISDLRQSSTPMQIHQDPITSLFLSPDRLLAGCGQKLFIPTKGEYYVEWGFSDGSVRVFTVEGDRLVGLAENLHSLPISCATFADENTLLTGSADTTVCVWQVRFGKSFEIQLKECLRGHSGRVTTVSYSKSFSVIVSGSEDGTAIVWDLNRLKYVRTLRGHVGTVEVAAVNDMTGDIATCSGPYLHWWTINGDLYAEQMICADDEHGILSCVFYDGIGHEWIAKDLLFTGHKDGVIRIWSRYVRKGLKANESPWQLNLVHELHHDDGFGKKGQVGDVTTMLISGQQKTLYTGTSGGRVWNWTLPDSLAGDSKKQSSWIV